MISNELGLHSPSLPAYLLYPVALLSLLIILFVMARTRDRSAAFLIGAAWLRYIMSAFHTITYRPLAAGMSANALASIGLFLDRPHDDQLAPPGVALLAAVLRADRACDHQRDCQRRDHAWSHHRHHQARLSDRHHLERVRRDATRQERRLHDLDALVVLPGIRLPGACRSPSASASSRKPTPRP